MTEPSSRQLLLGVDVGGTFTDASLMDESSGQLWVVKAPTTPGDFTDGIVAAIEKALATAAARPDDVVRIRHGSTVATNAILESRGARAALVMTRGFRDVLEIGRHDIPREANLYLWEKPKRPVAADRIIEVAGRLAVDGSVVEPLLGDDCLDVAKQIEDLGVESVAICLLHSYANPEHELQLAHAIQQRLPAVDVSVSHEVLPVFREYERAMATVLNAYVQPTVRTYLARLERRLPANGLQAKVSYMQSNGGVISRQSAERQSVRMALSGPAAGVVGAGHTGTSAGVDDVISIDIGGTSADVSLIRGGTPQITVEGSVGHWPMHLPMVDIVTIGAGGGSIASTTEVGSLVVGPRSAGADPGPACYGRGGLEPTVTDANLALGRLSSRLASGGLVLDEESARKAIERSVASPLGLSVEDAAYGILQVVNNTMAGALREVSVERGFDARTFALVPLGGAGPLHGADLAELLGMTRVVVPPTPGVLASLGLLLAELRNDYVQTVMQPADSIQPGDLEATFAELEEAAQSWLEQERIEPEHRTIRRHADLRYADQGFEVTVPLDGDGVPQLVGRFHDAHQRLYTFNSPDTTVEVTALRIVAQGERWAPQPVFGRGGSSEAAAHGRRPVWSAGRWCDAPVFLREKLGVGWTATGPTVIEQGDTTVLVPVNWTARVDDHLNLILERG